MGSTLLGAAAGGTAAVVVAWVVVDVARARSALPLMAASVLAARYSAIDMQARPQQARSTTLATPLALARAMFEALFASGASSVGAD
jgi:hypothetical protein